MELSTINDIKGIFCRGVPTSTTDIAVGIMAYRQI